MGISESSITIINSGNGLHLIIRVQNYPASHIATYKTHYQELCLQLNTEFLKAGLSGKADSSIWTQSRLLRMPCTTNRKPMKDPFGPDAKVTEAHMVHTSEIVLDSFDWPKFTPPEENPNFFSEENLDKCKAAILGGAIIEGNNKHILQQKEYKPVQPDYVMRECRVLAHQLKIGGKDTSEPLWYACLDVVKIFPSPEKEHYALHISNKHKDYTSEETLEKLEQASGLKAPRLCSSISEVGGEQCQECPWKNKVKTPSSLSVRECPPEIALAEAEFGELPSPELFIENSQKGQIAHQKIANCQEKDQKTTFSTKNITKSRENDPGSRSDDQKAPEKIKIDWQQYIDLGFTTIKTGPRGGTLPMIREVNLLRQFFHHHTHFVNIISIRRCMVFKEGFYQPYTKEEVKAFAKKYYRPTTRKDNELEEFHKTVSIANLVKQDFLQSTTEGLINLQNGVLEIASGNLLDHTPKYGFTYKLPYNYNDNAKCEVWDQLLKNVTCNRSHLTAVLEEYLGYCVYGGAYIFNKVLIMFGEGANGKTTLVKAFQQVLGISNCSAIEVSAMGKSFIAAGLENKLANFSEEEDKKCFKETGHLKRISGEGSIWVENKYEKGYQLENKAKIIMTYNEMPFLNDLSKGMKRRLLIIPFDLDLVDNPKKMIPNINAKIKKELPGILNRALAGWKRLQKRGDFPDIHESVAMVKDIEEYSRDNFEDWWINCVELTDSHKDVLASRDAFHKYQNETDDRRTTISLFGRKFNKKCKKLGLYNGTIDVDGKRFKGTRGIRISVDSGEILQFDAPSQTKK